MRNRLVKKAVKGLQQLQDEVRDAASTRTEGQAFHMQVRIKARMQNLLRRTYDRLPARIQGRRR